MRILHVTDFFPPVRGGLEGHVDDLAAAQVARGHDVHVATLTAAPEPRDERVVPHVVRAAASSLLPHVDRERPFHPPLPDPRARRDLGRVLDEVAPDVVHAHSWLGVSLPRHRVPVVLTAHDYALICQLHTLFSRDGSACDGPGSCVSCGSASYGWVRSAFLAPGTAVGRRLWHLDAVVTLSAFVADTIRPFVSAPVHPCGGLLPPAPPPTEVPGLPDEPFALFAGDPGAHKGLDALLSAWRGAPLVVASTKPVAARPGVTVVHLDRRQMASAWRRAAVAVVPSVWPEPFGMVAMEALAAGTPVVATAVGALPEIVRDGIDGVLVAPGDVRALVDAAGSLLADEPRRRRMGDAAIAGSDRFSADAVVERIDAVYQQVVVPAAVR